MSICNTCENAYKSFIIMNNMKNNLFFKDLSIKYNIDLSKYITNDEIISNNNITCGICYLSLKKMSENYFENIKDIFKEIAQNNNISYNNIYEMYLS